MKSATLVGGLSVKHLDCENILTTLRSETSGTPHTLIDPGGGRWGSIVFKLVFNCAVSYARVRPPSPATSGERGGEVGDNYKQILLCALWTPPLILDIRKL